MRYERARTTLSVHNGVPAGPPRRDMGGGRGLDGMRERIERTGGTMAAGSTDDGWRVELEVPA